MVSENKEHWFTKIENMHPYQTMMYLGMFGSGLIFLFLLLAFLGSQASFSFFNPLYFPKSFIISSFVLLTSAYTASKIVPHYRQDHTHKVKYYLWATLLLGLGFTAFQLLGWKELADKGISFQGLPSGSFLYVLSGIHILHLIGAMIFAGRLISKVQACEKDQVKNLILLSNPFDRMTFQLFATYWKFMDLVWIILFITLIWVI
jgi:cytochrome c oxidase subunit III